ncbi:MAG: hypothetical protein WAK29_16950 [Terriglobales bacterium]
MPKLDSNGRKQHLEHLDQVHALTKAISSAISAIENNDLRLIETHVAEQEVICNRLAAVKSAVRSTHVGDANFNPSDLQLRGEIREAHLALAKLNRVYASLLKRVRRSAEVITGIYRSRGEGYHQGPSRLAQQHTWSCEV